ncbi:ankyrin [Periconia macrospinosa]|uniref:Ankyrin n=1 Tax=Periconia macrospinosa TaxID=97972 RepID=A0A2V1D403_9PLEO|nr:ankyrin [Periconia macrospinosa]
MARRLRRDDYTVGWVCALPVELAAAQKMLDEEHGNLKPNVGSNHDTDENLYVLGSIGGHNVAIGCLPAGRIGISPAAAVAMRMRATFRGLRFGLMVGIGGGVPVVEDIRLGDVVVSQPNHVFGGVVQYDSGKATPSGFQRTGSLNSPPEILLTAIARVRANELLDRSRVSEYVAELASTSIFQRSKTGPDILFQASYDHKEGQSCDACSTEKQVIRQPRDSEDVLVHYGTIASGSQVIKNAVERDKVSAELGGVLCFEMEAAGLMNNFPCLVIRGICDYADSHKNKRWQSYAAGTAAAYAKELLSVIPPADVANIRKAEGPITGAFDVQIRNETRAIEDHQDGNRLPNLKYLHPAEQLPSGRTTDSSLPLTSNEGRGVINPGLSAQRSLSTQLDTSILSAEQRKEIINDLHFKQRDARLLSLKPAQAKTCSWMLKNALYKEWTAANKLNLHHGFFWIKGKPGAGKSIMMKFLFNGAKKTMKGCLILSFFFNARGESLEKSTRGLYRSLLIQLLEKAPETWSIFNEYGERGVETIRDMGWQDETLRELFTLALQELEDRRVVCYVDALDECPEEDVREMIAFFEELGELEKRAEFRVCFSSRHYPEISIGTGLQLVLELEQEHKNDISVYIDTHLKLGKDTQAEDIKAEILRKSSGIFLWVHLVIPMLNKEYDRGRIKALKKRLTKIPTGLHDLFHEMLTRDEKNMNYLLVCVQILLFASRPLKPNEFRAALETYCEDDHTWYPCDSVHMAPENLRKFVLDVSKGLAEITKSKEPTVQFIHESVRDFFLKEGGINKLRPDEENPEGLGHDMMKEICSQQLLYHNHSTPKFFKPSISELLPLLKYATENVCYHANSAQKFRLDQHSFLKNFDIENWVCAYERLGGSATLLPYGYPHPLYLLAEYGSAELIRIHPERSKYLELKNGRFRNPLLAALYAGHSDAARAFLDLPPQKVEEPNQTAKTKLRRDHALLREDFKHSRRFLSYLCEFGDVEMLDTVLRSGRYDFFAPEAGKIVRQCLKYASSEGVVEKLAEFGLCSAIYINSSKDDGQAPLLSPDDESLTDVHLPHFKSILRENPSIVNEKWVYPFQNLLDYASSKGFDQIARLCIKNSTVNERRRALYEALDGRINQQGRVAIMKYLTDAGVDLEGNESLKEHIAFRLFNAICRPYNEDVVAFLLSASLIKMDYRSYLYGRYGWTLFHWAVQQGRKSYVKLFLSSGCDPMVRDSRQATVLMHTVKVGDLSSFRCILEHEMCDPNLQDEIGRTALLWCAMVADECAVTMASELLKRTDVDPNLKDNSGRTALMRAVQSGKPRMVEILLQSKSTDPNLGSSRGSTPLRIAFKLYLDAKLYSGREPQDFWEISRLLLLTFKVNPDSLQRLPTPFQIAHDNGLSRLVRLLEVFYRCYNDMLEIDVVRLCDLELQVLHWNNIIDE